MVFILNYVRTILINIMIYYNYDKEIKNEENYGLYNELCKENINKYYDLFSDEIRKKADLLLKIEKF